MRFIKALLFLIVGGVIGYMIGQGNTGNYASPPPAPMPSPAASSTPIDIEN